MNLWRPALVAGAVFGLVLATARAQTPASVFRLHSEPVPLDLRHPQRVQVGALTYAGGLVLTAPANKAFGGLSGIVVRPDGRFLSQTDAGDLVSGRLLLDGEGRLTGIGEPAMARLTDETSRPYPAPKGEADAEDITLLPDGGFAVSFEGRPRVLAYAGEGPGRRLGIPAEAERLPPNTGLEALAAWTDGAGRSRLAEGAEDGRAWSCDLEGRDCVQILDGGDNPGRAYHLTGLAPVPGGRGLLAVYRAFDLLRGFRAIVAWVRPEAAQKTTVLARLSPPLTVDNMEGVAATAKPDGSIRIYLVSDDNFLVLQRTLLLAFDWEGGAAAP